jgi:hypothetical protein
VEEGVTKTLDKELKGITTVVKQQVQELCEEINRKLQVM